MFAYMEFLQSIEGESGAGNTDVIAASISEERTDWGELFDAANDPTSLIVGGLALAAIVTLSIVKFRELWQKRHSDQQE